MAKKLRQLTRERFQEEVARELGIDLSQADRVKPPIPELERALHDEDGDENEPPGEG